MDPVRFRSLDIHPFPIVFGHSGPNDRLPVPLSFFENDSSGCNGRGDGHVQPESLQSFYEVPLVVFVDLLQVMYLQRHEGLEATNVESKRQPGDESDESSL